MENNAAVCGSPWCKATFNYLEIEMVEIDGVMCAPRKCPKCKSFDGELSDGITWTDKEYEGSRFDGTPHQIRYKVTNFRL